MRLIYSLLLIAIFSNKLLAQLNCEDLIYYRDVELKKQYYRAFDKYNINQEAIADFKKIKDDLLNRDNEWWEMSTKTAISNGGLASAQLLQILKTACNLVSNSLKINPATGIAMKGLEKTAIAASNIYKAISLGENLNSIVSDGAEYTAYKNVLEESGPVGQAIKTVWDFIEDTKKMTAIANEQGTLKKEVLRILNMIEVKIEGYTKKVESSKNQINDINQAILGIDKYLAENCQDYKPKAPAKNSLGEKEKSVKSDNVITTISNKDIKGAYSFFYTKLVINDSIYGITSQPFFHTGQSSDQLNLEKKNFINQIKNYFPKKVMEGFLELNGNKFPEIDIINFAPYSDKILATKTDCEAAIREHVNMLRSITADLPGAEKQVYLQMNK